MEREPNTLTQEEGQEMYMTPNGHMDLYEVKSALRVAKLEAEREMEEWRGRNAYLYREAEELFRDASAQLARLEGGTK
jgi:hypothetical protein